MRSLHHCTRGGQCRGETGQPLQGLREPKPCYHAPCRKRRRSTSTRTFCDPELQGVSDERSNMWPPVGLQDWGTGRGSMVYWLCGIACRGSGYTPAVAHLIELHRTSDIVGNESAVTMLGDNYCDATARSVKLSKGQSEVLLRDFLESQHSITSGRELHRTYGKSLNASSSLCESVFVAKAYMRQYVVYEEQLRVETMAAHLRADRAASQVALTLKSY